MISIKPIPCSHIWEYYHQKQKQQPCIGFNLLRIGYAQCAIGRIDRHMNNLFGRPTLVTPNNPTMLPVAQL